MDCSHICYVLRAVASLMGGGVASCHHVHAQIVVLSVRHSLRTQWSKTHGAARAYCAAQPARSPALRAAYYLCTVALSPSLHAWRSYRAVENLRYYCLHAKGPLVIINVHLKILARSCCVAALTLAEVSVIDSRRFKC